MDTEDCGLSNLAVGKSVLYLLVPVATKMLYRYDDLSISIMEIQKAIRATYLI